MSYRVGYFVGSLSSTSINRKLSQALVKLAPQGVEFTEIRIDNLPVYSQDYDENYPAEGVALKEAVKAVDAVLFVTPEFNRSIPGGLKNAIDWASRPWGTNSFDHKPVAVIGASPGALGTALAQQSLRAVLSFLNTRQMTSPEGYVTLAADTIAEDFTIPDESTREFLTTFMKEFDEHARRVLTVLPPKR